MGSRVVLISGALCCLGSWFTPSRGFLLAPTHATNTGTTGLYHPSTKQDAVAEGCKLYPIKFLSPRFHLPSQWIRFTCTCGYAPTPPPKEGVQRLPASCPTVEFSDKGLFRERVIEDATNSTSDSCTVLAKLKIIPENVPQNNPWDSFRLSSVRCKTAEMELTVDIFYTRSANGGHCNEPDDCYNVNQTCISSKCSCPLSKPVFVERSENSCYPSAGVGEACQHHQQCSFGGKRLIMICSRKNGMICVQYPSVKSSKSSKKTDAMFTAAIAAVACFAVTVIALFVLFMCNRSVFRRRPPNYPDDTLHRRGGHDVFSVADQLARERLADKPPTYQDVVRNDRMVRGVPPPVYASEAEAVVLQRTTAEHNYISRLASQLRRSTASAPASQPSAASSGHLFYRMTRDLTETHTNSTGERSNGSGGLVPERQSTRESPVTIASNSSGPGTSRNTSATDETASGSVLGITLRRETSDAGIPVMQTTLFATSSGEMTRNSSERLPISSTKEIDLDSSESRNQTFLESSKVEGNAEFPEHFDPNLSVGDNKNKVVPDVVTISRGAHDNRGYVSES